MDETVRTSGGKRNPGLILIFLAMAVVIGYLGYFLGTKNAARPVKAPGFVGLEANGLKLGPESIIRSQQAVAAGKVAKVDTGSITISGDDGRVGVFNFASPINIYPRAASAAAVTKPSQNTNDIQVGEIVILSMTLEGNQYLVNSVSFLPKGTSLK